MKNITITLCLLWMATAVHSQIELVNAGIGGNNSAQLLHRFEQDVIALNPDLAIIMVGTNDMLNSKKMLSYKSYKKNLCKIVKGLKSEGIHVLLMSSPPADSAYLYSRHDKNLYKQLPNEKMDSVRCLVKGLAIKYDVMFLDLFQIFSDLGLPKHNEDLFIRNKKNSGVTDGVHPTSLGYYFIAENVYQFLKQQGLLKVYNRIVCFGDSITAGAGSKGGGTVSGENYPSFLCEKLNQ